MSILQHTVVLVLRSGGGFSFRDVVLIVQHINGKWKSEAHPRIICLWDNASQEYDLGNLKIIPLTNNYPGTWARMQLYNPEMEQYRPFLYIDLDTVVVDSLENIFELVKNPSQFITLEDFWQRGQLATGLVWVPANSDKIRTIWKAWVKQGFRPSQKRMDRFLRKVVKQDVFWQDLTKSIHDAKPRRVGVIPNIPEGANILCFHGKPRIHNAIHIPWVNEYVNTSFKQCSDKKKVTVIIPYNKDRGWLKDAIQSVPDGVQLILSQGSGNWPENFNKVLHQAEGAYIKYLHEDDMLTPNCIEDSVNAIEEQEVDFIHGEAIEVYQGTGKKVNWKPSVKIPTLQDLLVKNAIHSATLMYKKEVFEKVGGFDETLNTAEEYEFNLRSLQAGLKIGYCPTPLAFYRRHSQQKVRVVSKQNRTREREMVKSKYNAG